MPNRSLNGDCPIGGAGSSDGDYSLLDIPRKDATLAVDAALKSCAAGDKLALKLIYDIEAARMLNIAIRILKNRAIAEEAVQDTLTLVWRNAIKFDAARGSALTWMYSILRNRCCSILRQEKLNFNINDISDEQLVCECDDPETAILKRSDAERVFHVLALITPIQREIVTLSFFDGVRHREIAKIYDMPLGSVKTLIRRTLLTLRQRLLTQVGLISYTA